MKQYPDLDLRMVFDNPNRTLSKQSKTTYGMWCDEHAIPYATKYIPRTWVEEADKLPSLLTLADNGIVRKVAK